MRENLLWFILLLLLAGSCTYLRETPSYREQELQERRQRSSPAPSAAPGGFYADYSRKLGYTLNGNENPDLLREIVSWLGTPYRYGGTSRSGADCSGFALQVYKEVYGINLARVTANMAQHSTRVNRRNLREGDLVFFRISGRKISHVGIYISNNKFAHASTSRGVIISDLDENYYNDRFAFGGRVRR